MQTLKDEFLEILSNYQGILHKVNLIYFRNKTDREDNFQEIIYQLWKSFPGLQNRKSIGSWIYTVSINTSISRLKKESRIEYHEKLPESADRFDIVEELTLNEKFRMLLKAIYHLNEIDKSIMLLFLEERSYDEIAEILGISKSNVGVRINRAKELLKQRIRLLSGWLLGKYSRLYIVLIPILLVMINLSIHVYYEYKPFIEVMKDEESIYGLIISFVVGLFVSWFAVNRIRRFQIKNLEFLKELHDQLCQAQ
jgi:RNA polymerase sigma-70 factor (ECF subfamily)